MCRRNRSSLINPDEITIVHAVAKTARNLFLIGQDHHLKSDFSHRKDWVFSIMEFQSSLMAVDVLDFAVMSNHIHFVLRSRPDVVKAWDDQEVARRWLTLCPKSKTRTVVDGQVIYVPRPPKASEIATTVADKARIKKLRQQLSSISWWMRLLCQKVAQRANFEDGISMGHFFKGRFHSVVINDEPHLLACSVYVDLNAIKAAMAETLDGYKYTSASVRIEQIRLRHMAKAVQNSVELQSIAAVQTREDTGGIATISANPTLPKIETLKGGFLSPIKINKLSQLPELHTEGYRCSDKGFLDISEEQYIELLEWCIKNKLLDRDSATPKELPICLQTRSVAIDLWITQVRDFDQLYRYEAGLKPAVESLTAGTQPQQGQNDS